LSQYAHIIHNTLEGLGFEVVDINWQDQTMQIFIDFLYSDAVQPDSPGVEPQKFPSVEDCAKCSRQLSYIFHVENIPYNRLEVSTPGIDRPLKNPKDFMRFTGCLIDVALYQAASEQKKFSSQRLLRADNDGIYLELDDASQMRHQTAELHIAYSNIQRAKVCLENYLKPKIRPNSNSPTHRSKKASKRSV